MKVKETTKKEQKPVEQPEEPIHPSTKNRSKSSRVG